MGKYKFIFIFYVLYSFRSGTVVRRSYTCWRKWYFSLCNWTPNLTIKIDNLVCINWKMGEKQFVYPTIKYGLSFEFWCENTNDTRLKMRRLFPTNSESPCWISRWQHCLLLAVWMTVQWKECSYHSTRWLMTCHHPTYSAVEFIVTIWLFFSLCVYSYVCGICFERFV